MSRKRDVTYLMMFPPSGRLGNVYNLICRYCGEDHRNIYYEINTGDNIEGEGRLNASHSRKRRGHTTKRLKIRLDSIISYGHACKR